MIQKLEVALCEDESAQQERIRGLLADYSVQKNIECTLDSFESGEAFLTKKKNYNIILLDILLGNGPTGLEVGQRIRKEGYTTPIILITSLVKYVQEGYKIDAHRYLIKPVDKEEFYEAMDSCIKKLDHSKRRIHILSGRQEQLVEWEKILYIESCARKRIIHTINEDIPTSTTLKSFLEQLPPDEFGVPTNSHIVNFSHVKTMNRKYLLMDNGETIWLSRGRVQTFYNQFGDYMKP